MDSARFAERLLGWVTNCQRASEIIGDLVEQRRTHGLGLWGTVLQVIVMTLARPAIACVLATFTALAMTLPYSSRLLALRLVGRPPANIWEWLAAYSCMLIPPCWTIACLVFGRFGLRSTYAVLGLTLALLLTGVSCMFPKPAIAATLMCCIAALVVLALVHRSSRLPLLGLLLATATLHFTSLAFNYGNVIILRERLLLGKQFQNALNLYMLGTWFGSMMLSWVTLGYLHRWTTWLVPPPLPRSSTE